MIATFIEAEIVPEGPVEWRVAGAGVPIADAAMIKADDARVIRRFRVQDSHTYWKKSASTFGGSGLEQGSPSRELVDKAIKSLKKNDQPQAAKLLKRASCGGAAVGARFELNVGCRRCGCALETPEHRY